MFSSEISALKLKDGDEGGEGGEGAEVPEPEDLENEWFYRYRYKGSPVYVNPESMLLHDESA